MFLSSYNTMRIILKFIYKNKHSIFYAFLTGFGLVFAIQLLKDYGLDKFLFTVIITSLILFLEIYLNWRFATKVLRQIDMPSVNVYNLWGHLLNHISLPLLLFYSLAGFIYFNSDDLIRLIAISFLVIINVTLFINVRSYYRDEFKVEESTRYIYDVIKLIVFFFCINLILHVKILLQVDLWISALGVCALVLILGFLVIYRTAQLGFDTIIYVICASFVISIFFMILNIFGFMLLGINVIIFLTFYMVLSILHHKMERTLTLGVFTEYFLILLLAFLLFSGIN